MAKALADKTHRDRSQGLLKGVSIIVPLTSCLTGLEQAVRQLTIFVFICKTDSSKPVKQEVNGTLILPPLVFPVVAYTDYSFTHAFFDGGAQLL